MHGLSEQVCGSARSMATLNGRSYEDRNGVRTAVATTERRSRSLETKYAGAWSTVWGPTDSPN